MEVLSFHYHLNISFDQPINKHYFTLRCFPKTDSRQHITQINGFISPRQSLSKSSDSFGNYCIIGRATEPHQYFEADVCGEAVTGLRDSVPEGNPYRENIFRYQSSLTKPDKLLRDYARSIPDMKTSLDTAEYIMDALSRDFTYTPGITNVKTTAADAFALKQGVCQDYSHIMLSLLREKGYHARYVVGMLMGEGASHAWVEVKHSHLWYAFDPTNNLKVTDSHIKISHGRDYNDCLINQGSFYGNANQTQTISVIVQKATTSVNAF